MLLYAEHITPRLLYVIAYLEEYVFSEKLEVTQDKVLFAAHQGISINYSNSEVAGEAWTLRPAGLLAENSIRSFQPAVANANHRKALFPVAASDFPFDVFSAVFYLLSRYEEYLPHEADAYGRYAHWNSQAWKHGFLDWPQIDYWLEDFKQSLTQRFPEIKFRKQTFNFIPTYDIDIAWSYRHKGFNRMAGALLKDILLLNLRRVRERIGVITYRQHDPFDVYQWLDEQHTEYALKPLYFFLLAASGGELDKNIHPGNKSLQSLVKLHADKYKTGIHPSVWSNTHSGALKDELCWYERIVGSKPRLSRQHYLRFHLPQTYRQLTANGITDDYSMGYGTVNGFRASTSRCFNWYDLENERSTSLRIHPMAYMEANSFYESCQTPSQALDELLRLYTRVKAVNGNFITVFHNHILGTDAMYKGWREMYAAFLRTIAD